MSVTNTILSEWPWVDDKLYGYQMYMILILIKLSKLYPSRNSFNVAIFFFGLKQCPMRMKSYLVNILAHTWVVIIWSIFDTVMIEAWQAQVNKDVQYTYQVLRACSMLVPNIIDSSSEYCIVNELWNKPRKPLYEINNFP